MTSFQTDFADQAGPILGCQILRSEVQKCRFESLNPPCPALFVPTVDSVEASWWALEGGAQLASAVGETTADDEAEEAFVNLVGVLASGGFEGDKSRGDSGCWAEGARRNSEVEFDVELQPQRMAERATAGVASLHHHSLCELVLHEQNDSGEWVARVMLLDAIEDRARNLEGQVGDDMADVCGPIDLQRIDLLD